MHEVALCLHEAVGGMVGFAVQANTSRQQVQARGTVLQIGSASNNDD